MNNDINKIVDKIISENFDKRIIVIKNKIFEDSNMKKQICSECGSKNIYENECVECGSMYEVLNNEKECSECGSKNIYENECVECGSMYEVRNNEKECSECGSGGKEVMELGGMDDGHPRFGKKKLPKKMSQKEIEDLLRGDNRDYRDLNMYDPYYDNNLDYNDIDDNLNENFFKKFIDRIKGKTSKKIEKSEYDGLTDEQAKRLYNDANKILNKELNNGSNDDNLSAFYRLSIANDTIKGLKKHFPNINFNDDKSDFEKIDEYDMNEGVYPEMRKEDGSKSRNTHNQTKDDEITHYWKDSGKHTLKGKRDGDKFNVHSYETDSSDKKTKEWYQDRFNNIKGMSQKYEDNGDSFFLPGFGEISTYTPDEGELDEKLYGNQSRIDRNKNNIIDREDFKILKRRNTNKQTNKTNMYEVHLNESTNEKFIFNEDEILNIIETIVNEEKNKKTKIRKTDSIKLTRLNQEKSKKENDEYIDSAVKKIKNYLKTGSKGKYETNPKHFPKGNGELSKMEKMAYIPSDSVSEYIDNFTAAGLENLNYDDIHPDEDWVTDNVVGSSRTGNNPKWANAVETPNNQKRNNIRKDNLLSKIKNKAYNKSPQPIVNDTSGNKVDKGSKILMKLESQNERKVISDIEKIKNLISYVKNTQ